MIVLLIFVCKFVPGYFIISVFTGAVMVVIIW